MKKTALIIFAVLLLYSCGGGGSSAGSSDLIVRSVSGESTAGSGQFYDITYKVYSAKAESGVVTKFYLVEDGSLKSKTSERDDVATQYYIGADSFNPSAGVNTRGFSIQIPSEITASGSFYIVADIDPDNLIDEANESNNSPENNSSAVSSSTVSLDASTADDTNLIIDNVELQSSSIVFDSYDTGDPTAHTALGNADGDHPFLRKAHLKGHVNIVVEGKEPSAAEMNNVKLKVQVNVGGTWRDVDYWSNTLQTFSGSTTFALLNRSLESLDDDEESVPMTPEHTMDIDVSFPEAVVDDMVAYAASNTNTFEVRVILNSDDAVAETTKADNTYSMNVSIYSAGVSASPYMLENSFKKHVGDRSKIRLGVEMYSNIGLVMTADQHGALCSNGISFPITVFKHSSTLIDISSIYAAYADDPNNSGYSNKIEFLGTVVDMDENWALPQTISYPKSWNQTQEIANAELMVGPVPVNVETGATGTIGYVLSITLNSTGVTSSNHLPDASLGLYAEAGVGTSSFSAGPVVDLTLIEELLKVVASSSFTYNSGDDDLDDGTLGLTVTNDIDAISGKFGLYVKYRTVKWCHKFGVPYPCGTKKKKSTKWIYETDSLYHKKSTLLNESHSWTF
ncbi:MAG: hypothetical protein AB7E96_06320 [Deferribacterales bacterium]